MIKIVLVIFSTNKLKLNVCPKGTLFFIQTKQIPTLFTFICSGLVDTTKCVNLVNIDIVVFSPAYIHTDIYKTFLGLRGPQNNYLNQQIKFLFFPHQYFVSVGAYNRQTNFFILSV